MPELELESQPTTKTISTVPSRRRRWLALIVLGVALLGAVAVAIAPEYILDRRLIRDDADRIIYMLRGSFVILPDARPYRDVPSEYPQLATYLCAVPYIYELVYAPDYKVYMAVFTFLMAFTLGVLALVWLAMAREVMVNELLVLALILPGTLYFTLNRFDVLPALLGLSALTLLTQRRPVLAHAMLAVAVLTKAYPVLFLPLFVVETRRQAGWRKVLIGLAVFIGVIAVFSAQLALWSGPAAILEPFKLQLGRHNNQESLFYILTSALPSTEQILIPVFLALQGLLAVASLSVRSSSPRVLLRWATAITLAFVLFNRFQSPQWVVWITPLALLASVSSIEIALTVIQDILAYIFFPIIFDQPIVPWMLPAVILTLTFVRLVLVVMLLRPPERLRAQKLI